MGWIYPVAFQAPQNVELVASEFSGYIRYSKPLVKVCVGQNKANCLFVIDESRIRLLK